MKTLNIEVKPAIFVDVYNLLEFLAEKYGITDDRISPDEGNNDTDYVVDITKEDPLFEAEEAEEIVRTASCPVWNFCSLLEDAARKGFIERGCYVLRLSW
jgi:hypothetical protein